MSNNIFEDYQQKKQQIIALADKAAQYGLITSQRKMEIINKIENETLTIGVIGQMKAGKSTFLNAFVFGDDVLPAATTPMTAALSMITYGEKPKVVAEFYTKDDWSAQQMQASRSESSTEDDGEKSKIKAAKELTKIAEKKLGCSLNSMLGRHQEDRFENLVEYVGAEGKYVGITKSVTIYYPKEYLKGVNIVDTPGVNDPIVSREERTKEFLQKCDVVVLMLYAQKAMDATDTALLFDNVYKCGIGRVLIGINKYDICIGNGETDGEIIANVEENIRKAADNRGDRTLLDLLKEVRPIPMSAEAALLTQIGMDKVNRSPEYKHAYKRYLEIWDDAASPNALRRYSHIEDMENAIINLINNEKGEILFSKPKNEIMAKVKESLSKKETAITDCTNKIKILDAPDNELEHKLDDLNTAKRKTERKLDHFSRDFDSELSDNLIPSIEKSLNRKINELHTQLNGKIDNLGMLTSIGEQVKSIEHKIKEFTDKILPDEAKEQTRNVKKKLKSFTGEYFNDVEELISDKLPNLDFYDFLTDLKTKIDVETDNKFDYELSEKFGKVGFNVNFFAGIFGILPGLLGQALITESTKMKLKNDVDEVLDKIKFDAYINSLKETCHFVINSIKNEGVSQLIEPLIESVESFMNDKAKREEELATAKSSLETLKKEKETLQSQANEIEAMM
ncbi:MAG: dynamin family protein [Spirochaetales bacterium]|nr:dynamin family protein [Spirochaetales bacterium]